MAIEPQIRLGTRNSPLAMAQAREARDRLCKLHGWDEHEVALVEVVASGDKILDRPLADIGGKALWTKELDQWLATGEIDAAVHSMKDVETLRPGEFTLGAILPRADRRDVLVGAVSLEALPEGAKVGTSAPRRAAQLLNARPDCEIVGIRGNVATRLAKLSAGEADATFLAKAGLDRLGQDEVGAALNVDRFLPAAGQGAIGIECRANDEKTMSLLAPLDDFATRAEVLAERSLLAGLGGNCHSPVAVHCQLQGEMLTMRAMVLSIDGKHRVEKSAEFAADDLTGPIELAKQLLADAPEEIRDIFEGSDA